MLDFFEIEGLFGIRKIHIPFTSDSPVVKILVGSNGSYKTTITNLLHAVLSKDFNKVKNIDFTKLRIKFTGENIIEFERKDIFPEKDYKRIIQSSSFYKELTEKTTYNSGMILDLINDMYSDNKNNISYSIITEVVNEINNSNVFDLQRDLEHEINLFKLTSRKDEIKRKEKHLKNLNRVPNLNILFLPTYRRLELVIGKEQQEKVDAILNTSVFFGMSDIKRDFNTISSRIRDLWLEELLSNNEPQPEIVREKIDEGKRKREFLQENVERFISVCNKYLDNKSFVTDRVGSISLKLLNESDDNNKLDLNFLSSGEKQLVSLFSKLYLKVDDISDKYYLFIDEPETSLSIEWQEMLLKDIIESKSCEFLFVATHSPFIFKNDLINHTVDIKDYVFTE